MTGTKTWWVQNGCSELNRILIDLQGKDIGQVPLENLLAPDSMVDQDELLNLLINDGVRAILWNYGKQKYIVIRIE